MLCLEERRKGFGGYIFLGIQCSDWLADTVEKALLPRGKEDFAKSFCEEVGVLKVHTRSNKAGCFLEEAIFVEGGRRGVIRLPEGRGGWGWRRFVDELQHLLALLVAKDQPRVPISDEDVVRQIRPCGCACRDFWWYEAVSCDCSGSNGDLLRAREESSSGRRHLSDEGIEDLALAEEDPCQG